MKALYLSAFYLLLLLCFPNAHSQTLLIEGIKNEPANALEGIPRPRPGMTAKRVEEIFGSPVKTYKAVGRPPISRWVYKDFVVFFERDRVVNTVIRKPNE